MRNASCGLPSETGDNVRTSRRWCKECARNHPGASHENTVLKCEDCKTKVAHVALESEPTKRRWCTKCARNNTGAGPMKGLKDPTTFKKRLTNKRKMDTPKEVEYRAAIAWVNAACLPEGKGRKKRTAHSAHRLTCGGYELSKLDLAVPRAGRVPADAPKKLASAAAAALPYWPLVKRSGLLMRLAEANGTKPISKYQLAKAAKAAKDSGGGAKDGGGGTKAGGGGAKAGERRSSKRQRG